MKYILNKIEINNQPGAILVIRDPVVLTSGDFIFHDSAEIKDQVILSLDVFYDDTYEKVWYCVDSSKTTSEADIEQLIESRKWDIIEAIRSWDNTGRYPTAWGCGYLKRDTANSP